jgi:hypothetical protein
MEFRIGVAHVRFRLEYQIGWVGGRLPIASCYSYLEIFILGPLAESRRGHDHLHLCCGRKSYPDLIETFDLALD